MTITNFAAFSKITNKAYVYARILVNIIKYKIGTPNGQSNVLL